LLRNKNYTGNWTWTASGSGQRPVVSSCKHGNEPLDYMKGEEFDWLSDY